MPDPVWPAMALRRMVSAVRAISHRHFPDWESETVCLRLSAVASVRNAPGLLVSPGCCAMRISETVAHPVFDGRITRRTAHAKCFDSRSRSSSCLASTVFGSGSSLSSHGRTWYANLSSCVNGSESQGNSSVYSQGGSGWVRLVGSAGACGCGCCWGGGCGMGWVCLRRSLSLLGTRSRPLPSGRFLGGVWRCGQLGGSPWDGAGVSVTWRGGCGRRRSEDRFLCRVR